MPENVYITKGEKMNDTDLQLLKAIHAVEKRVVGLETKIDESVTGRFKDLERRIEHTESKLDKLDLIDDTNRRVGNIESYGKWFILLVLGAVVGSIIKLVVT